MKKIPKSPTPPKRGPGRPPVNDPSLTDVIWVRCTPEQKEAWKEFAAHLGHRYVGTWLRFAAEVASGRALKGSRS